jgi:hypothetical protein
MASGMSYNRAMEIADGVEQESRKTELIKEVASLNKLEAYLRREIQRNQ